MASLLLVVHASAATLGQMADMTADSTVVSAVRPQYYSLMRLVGSDIAVHSLKTNDLVSDFSIK